MFLFLDLEKVFVNITWFGFVFLLNILQNVGCGPEFWKWVQGIYSNQQAKILITGKLTKATTIEKRNKSGLSLVTSTVYLVMEILATKIRQGTRIKGIKVDDIEFKMKSYADDVVLTVLDPQKL